MYNYYKLKIALCKLVHLWALSWKKQILLHANNKGADQHSLINAFDIRSL